uniref:F-box domain-containing protein n=1 Tax=Panagrolaimus sp. JU765 TaxID=591449 RepID=A0AC34RK64_9BILA
MTDNFNFLGLPKEVRELIIDEIVQIPEDRIELALTSKYCNEVVKRKNPKKTIDRLTIESPSRLTFMSNSRIYVKKKEQLMEILSNCQIKKLVLADKSKSITPNYSEILDMLFEAAKFATKLDIIPIHPVYMDEIVGFYTKLKYLKSVTIGNPKFILPYYPSKVRLVLGRRQPENYLQGLAKKSRNCPLSVFKLECGFFCFGECQQFLPVSDVIA